jgi:hypothetical protein
MSACCPSPPHRPPASQNAQGTQFYLRAACGTAASPCVAGQTPPPPTSKIFANAANSVERRLSSWVLAAGNSRRHTHFRFFHAVFQRSANRPSAPSHSALPVSSREWSHPPPDARGHTQARAHHRVRGLQYLGISWNSWRPRWLALELGSRHYVNCCCLCWLRRMASVLCCRAPRLAARCCYRCIWRIASASTGLGICNLEKAPGTQRHNPTLGMTALVG